MAARRYKSSHNCPDLFRFCFHGNFFTSFPLHTKLTVCSKFVVCVSCAFCVVIHSRRCYDSTRALSVLVCTLYVTVAALHRLAALTHSSVGVCRIMTQTSKEVITDNDTVRQRLSALYRVFRRSTANRMISVLRKESDKFFILVQHFSGDGDERDP